VEAVSWGETQSRKSSTARKRSDVARV